MLKLWTSKDLSALERLVRPALRSLRRAPEVRGAAFDPEDPALLLPARGSVVLAMGSGPVEALKEARAIPRNLSIDKLRGRLWPGPGGPKSGHWMVTYDPGLVDVQEDASELIRWDAKLACRYLTEGTLQPKVGRYAYVDDFRRAVDAIKREADRTGARVRVSEDLETVGLYPWYPDRWIVSVQLCIAAGSGEMVVFPKLGDMPSRALLRQIEWVENADEVSLGGANLKFDNLWKRVKWGLESPRSYLFDTLLAGGLVCENRSNSLNAHAKVYTDMGGYDDPMNQAWDKGRMDLIYAEAPEDFLVYSCGDVDACARARPRIVEELQQDPALLDFYVEVLHPASVAFEDIEREGVLVDAEKLKAVGAIAEAEAAKAQEEMRAIVPARVKRKMAGKTGDHLKFTPAVLREVFFGEAGWGLKPRVFTEKSKEPSTSTDDHLKMFAREHPRAGAFLNALRRSNRAEKIKSSYVDGFLEHLRPDGRFHPTFSLYVGSQFDDGDDAGTVTGRTSAKGPHVQTIPHRTKPGDYDWAKVLRACYPAPPGHLMGQLDVSQGELKIHAMLAEEPTMLELFRSGKDMHVMTGAHSLRISYDEMVALESTDPAKYKFARYAAKPQNFGLLYLQSPEGYQNYAYKQFDLDYTLAECEEIHEAFFRLYKRLVRYANHQQQEAIETGRVVSPLGRVRHLPLARSKNRKAKAKALRQAVNSPTQSVLSDLGLWALAIARRDLDLFRRGLRVFNFVHDAVQFYFPDTSAGLDLVRELRDTLENLPYERVTDWRPCLKMTTDFECGPNMAEMRKAKL